MSNGTSGSTRRCAIAWVEQLEARWLLSAVSVNTNTQYQTIEGFGASIKSWTQDATYDSAGFWNKVVGDLGANMIRGAVWPTFERANDNNDPKAFDWTKYDTQALAHVMEQFKQVDARTPDAKFNLTVWTAPWWMKTTNAQMHGGSLRPDQREEYAEYLAAVVITAKRDFGIDIDYLSIQNEPVFTLEYESMTMDPWQIRETIRAVNRRFKAEGLKTQLLIADDLLNPVRFRWLTEPTMTDSETRNFQGHFSIHGYASSPNWRGLRDVIESYDPDKPLQMTEGSGEPNDWGGAMTLAYAMRQAFEEGNSTSFNYWQFTDPSGPNSLTHNGIDTVKAPIFKQFSRYVRPGMRHVGSSSDDSRILPVSFRDPATGHVTVVLINNSHDEVPVNVNLSGANLPGSYKVVRTTQTSYNQSLGAINGSTGLNLTVPDKSVTTLYSGSAAPSVNSSSAPVRKTIQPLWDASTATAIHREAFIGTAASVQSRINAGDNPNATIASAWTPLHAAAASTSGDALAIIDALVNAGANVNARTSNDGMTPLHVAAANSTVKWPIDQNLVVNRLQKLVDRGANVNAKDNAGRTPLHWAALMGKIFVPATGPRTLQADMVEKLIDLGADVNAKDNAGLTPAQYAATHDYDLIVDALVAAGAQDPGNPPPPPPTTESTALAPAADTSVRDGTFAGNNFGSSGALEVKWGTSSGYSRESYLRFDLSSVSTIQSAKLRLYGRVTAPGGSIPVTVHGITSDPTWAEGSTTWNNKPTAGWTVRASTTVSSSSNQWQEWDLTNYLQSEKAAGRNSVTLVLKAGVQTVDPVVTFNSDEASGNRPQLLINGSSSTPSPTSQGLIVSASNLSVNEGASNSVTVKLAAQPSANVTVNLAKRTGGDASLTSATSSLTFTPSNWNTPQAVQIRAAEDTDTVNGTAVWDLTSSGLSSKVLNVSEVDNDVVSSRILRTVADTYVRDGSFAATNHGSSTNLELQSGGPASGNNREVYLRFDLSSVSSINSAKLRLFGRIAGGSGPVPVNVHGITSNPTWPESSTNWNNKPTAGWTIRASTTVNSTSDAWHEWNLTSYLQSEKAAGRNVATVVLKSGAQTSAPWLTFNSDEASSNRPELVIS